jgi:hypothetical protein
MFSSGTAGDNLGLRFSGAQLTIEYIQHPTLGSAAIEIDGTVAQVLNLTGEEAFGQQLQLRVPGDGDHHLRLLALDGIIAVDAILVPQVITPEQPPLDAGEIAERPAPDSHEEPALNADSAQLSERYVVEEPERVEPTETEVEVAPAAPLAPPIIENLDDGAANWSASGNWILTDNADADGVGSGWQASVGVEPAILSLRPALDLRSVSNPLLSFESRLIAAYSSASVEVSLDGVTWQPVAMLSPSADWQPLDVDLHAYRGQMVSLRFVWLSRLPQPDDPGVDMWLLDEVVIENALTVVPPTDEIPTATLMPTETDVPPVVDTPTPEPSIEATQPAPAAEGVPLDADAPSR